MDLLARVRQTIRRHRLLTRDTGVVAAVSGGSDSVALVYILKALADAEECRLVGLAHFNHQLREAANRDETLCVDLAASLQLPLIVDREDVRRRAQHERRSIEDAARTMRHAFLERTRIEFGADAIALGHTRDDQAETFLLRLLRGAGSRGLGSMHPKKGRLVRPLLECRRAELKAYLGGRGIPFVHDETNDDVSVPRNRVRAELLPLLEERFNPSIVDVLADEADLAREEYALLERLGDEAYSRVVAEEEDHTRLNIAQLAGHQSVLQRLVVRRAMMNRSGGRSVRFGDVQRVLDVALRDGDPFEGPGQRVERIGPDVVLSDRAAGVRGKGSKSHRRANLFRYALSIPGEVRVPEAGCVVSAEVVGSVRIDQLSARDGVAVVRLDKSTGAFAVRNRRPGDRFRPAGLGRRKKLQDFFVDRKVRQADRDRVPIVVDEQDRIVWVAGHAICEDFRVTDPAQAVLILRLKGWGGSF